MNKNENTAVRPGLIIGELFRAAPRAMSAFGVGLAAVVGVVIAGQI